MKKQSISAFLDVKKLLISAKWFYRQQKSLNLSIFWIFFRQGITVLSFINAQYVLQILVYSIVWRGVLAPHPHPSILQQPWKCPSWIGLKLYFFMRVKCISNYFWHYYDSILCEKKDRLCKVYYSILWSRTFLRKLKNIVT